MTRDPHGRTPVEALAFRAAVAARHDAVTDPTTILDDLLDVLATRPPRVHWARPAILHPVLVECAEALRDAGYSTVTGISREGAYLVARYRLHAAGTTP